MFTGIDFKNYIHSRKLFYDKLESFNIVGNNISVPIILDQNFFEKLNSNLEHFLVRRGESNKFSKAENLEYKRLLKLHFPETTPIFENDLPTIYWFKINNSSNALNENILRHYISSKEQNKHKGWWAQASWGRLGSNTEYLYVGKMERGFQNRFIQHIGLGHRFTSSLKLQSWITSIPEISLSFQFLKVDIEMMPHLEDIENVIWNHLNPLLGASPKIKM